MFFFLLQSRIQQAAMTGLLLFMGLIVLAADFASAGPVIPGTDLESSELAAVLPWPFVMSEEKNPQESLTVAVASCPPIKATRFNFVSQAPYRKSSKGNVFLRFHLTVYGFQRSSDADCCLQSIIRSAHPDTGLTYAWDSVAIMGSYVYHLHADCLLSEDYFAMLSDTLIKGLASENDRSGSILECRCGSGCHWDGPSRQAGEVRD